jgi:hypothetical protein
VNTCATCRWWENPWDTDVGFYLSGHQADDAKRESSRWGVCQRIGHPAHTETATTTERAFTADGSDYLSSLNTRDDFGCIEHEERE